MESETLTLIDRVRHTMHSRKNSHIPRPAWNFSSVYCSTSIRNVVLHAKENILFMVDLKHNPPHTTWASMRATHLICPCSFYAHLLTVPLMHRQ